jgi:hypothetical protein
MVFLGVHLDSIRDGRLVSDEALSVVEEEARCDVSKEGAF